MSIESSLLYDLDGPPLFPNLTAVLQLLLVQHQSNPRIPTTIRPHLNDPSCRLSSITPSRLLPDIDELRLAARLEHQGRELQVAASHLLLEGRQGWFVVEVQALQGAVLAVQEVADGVAGVRLLGLKALVA